MNLIEKIDALNIDIIVFGLYYIGIIFELLDIHHGNFRFTGMIVQNPGGLDILRKCLTGIDNMDNKPPPGKFPLRLGQQIQPVYNKIEFRNNILLLEVMG